MGRSRERVRALNARRSAVAVAMLVVVGLVTSCTTSGGGGTAPPPANQQFCEVWDQVAEAPTPDSPVLVKDDVVAQGEDSDLVGSNCNTNGARVDITDAMVAEGELVPSEQSANAPPTVAVTGQDISNGAPVLENVTFRNFNLGIRLVNFQLVISLSGEVAVQFSGTVSVLFFNGTLTDLNNWSIGVSTPGLSIPGMTQAPIRIDGTLASSNGVRTLELSASTQAIKVGDAQVRNAEIDLLANDFTGLRAYVGGSIEVGPSLATGSLTVQFDSAGTLVSIEGGVDAHLVGQLPDGKPADLTGRVSLVGNSALTSASFSASGVLGDLNIVEANGELSLSPNNASFTGVFDANQSGTIVRLEGSVVFESGNAFTSTFTAHGNGTISGTLPDGQFAKVSGTVGLTVINGVTHAQITGAIKLGELEATGNAVITQNGPVTTLDITGNIARAGVNASITGSVTINNGQATLIDIDGTVSGNLVLGDTTVQGAQLSVDSTGGPITVKVSGNAKVGTKANLSGNLDATVGPDGSLISLKGNLTGSMALDNWAIVNFSGSLTATPERVTVNGSGRISANSFPVSVLFAGTFTQALGSGDWSFDASGRLRLGPFDVASARLNLRPSQGMKATRVGFYFTFVIIPVYIELDVYMTPSGGCDHATVVGGSFLAQPTARLLLDGPMGCPVD
jgi:hypothetical protein